MTLRGRDRFQKYKGLIIFLTDIISLLPRKMRLFFFNHSRMIQGTKGFVIRYILLKTLAKYLGDNVSIHPDVYILNTEELYVGNNVSIHPMCYLEAKGGIKIGNDVSIAHAVTILSVNHIYTESDFPIKDQGINYKETQIEDNVWIGAKASILAGIVVGSGSIVGAGAVATKNVEKYSIVGGIPAKRIRYRK